MAPLRRGYWPAVFSLLPNEYYLSFVLCKSPVALGWTMADLRRLCMNLFSFSLGKAAGRVALLSGFLCAAVGYGKVLPPTKILCDPQKSIYIE